MNDQFWLQLSPLKVGAVRREVKRWILLSAFLSLISSLELFHYTRLYLLRSHLNPNSKNVVFSDKSKRVGSLLCDKVCANKPTSSADLMGVRSIHVVAPTSCGGTYFILFMESQSNFRAEPKI